MQALVYASAGLGVKVSASATSFYTDRTEESRGVSGNIETQRNFNGNQVYLTAKKPLYRKRDALAVDQAEAQLRSAEAQLESADQNLLGRVFLAWTEILAARDAVRISIDTFDRGAVILEEMERRFKAGDIAVDQLGLEVSRQHQRQVQVQEMEARLALAELALTDLAGPHAVVPARFALESAALNSLAKFSETDIRELVRQKNPELLAAVFAEEAARIERDKADADHAPVVDLYATASKGQNDTASYIKDENRIGIQISVPLYTSGAITASVAQAEALHRRMQAISHQTRMRLSTQAVQAYSKLKTGLLKIDATKTHLEATALRAESLRRGFLAGVSSRGDLGRAEADFHDARQRRTKEVADFANSWVAFATAVAQIDVLLQQSNSPARGNP